MCRTCSRTVQKPPSRAHNHAPSTLVVPSNTPRPRHNRPPGRTTMHPRGQLPHSSATIHHATALQGAQPCTLDPGCPLKHTTPTPQPPSRAHEIAPSTPVVPSNTPRPTPQPPSKAHNHAPSTPNAPGGSPTATPAPATVYSNSRDASELRNSRNRSVWGWSMTLSGAPFSTIRPPSMKITVSDTARANRIS